MMNEINLFEERSPTISHSKLNVYIDCSQKYHFIYDTDRRRIQTMYTEYGTSIHYGTEYFHNELNLTGEVPSVDSLIEPFIEKWEELSVNPDLELSSYKRNEFRLLGINTLKAYDREYRNTEWYTPCLGVEKDFNLPIVNPYTGQVIDEDYTMRGVIDLIHQFNNEIVVIDHKTSKVYKDHVIDNGFQLTMYQYAVERLIENGEIPNPKGLPIRVAYNFMPRSKNPQIVYKPSTRTKQHVERMLATVQATIKGIKNKVFIPNPNATWCHRCEFYDECLKFRGELI